MRKILIVALILPLAGCASQYASLKECEESAAATVGAIAGVLLTSGVGQGLGNVAAMAGGLGVGYAAGRLIQREVAADEPDDHRVYERRWYGGCRPQQADGALSGSG